MRATSVRICTRSFASRFDSGSSIRNAFGSRTIARPIATRWRWPPDRLAGLRSRCCSRSRIRAASVTWRSISALSVFASLSAKPMLSRTVMCGYSAAEAELVKLTVYVVDYAPEKFQALGAGLMAARAKREFPQVPVTLLGVQALFEPEQLVEIEGVAVA